METLITLISALLSTSTHQQFRFLCLLFTFPLFEELASILRNLLRDEF